MKDGISINEFTLYVTVAKRKYPSAKVTSIGTGHNDGRWYFVLYLDVDGKEIKYSIPIASK